MTQLAQGYTASVWPGWNVNPGRPNTKACAVNQYTTGPLLAAAWLVYENEFAPRQGSCRLEAAGPVQPTTFSSSDGLLEHSHTPLMTCLGCFWAES